MQLEKSGEIAPEKNEEAEPKQKQFPVVDVTGDGCKVWCCKEQYCIGSWNVKSMNQGTLEVVKARGVDGILAKLFQNLKDDAVKVLT